MKNRMIKTIFTVSMVAVLGLTACGNSNEQVASETNAEAVVEETSQEIVVEETPAETPADTTEEKVEENNEEKQEEAPAEEEKTDETEEAIEEQSENSEENTTEENNAETAETAETVVEEQPVVEIKTNAFMELASHLKYYVYFYLGSDYEFQNDNTEMVKFLYGYKKDTATSASPYYLDAYDGYGLDEMNVLSKKLFGVEISSILDGVNDVEPYGEFDPFIYYSRSEGAIYGPWLPPFIPDVVSVDSVATTGSNEVTITFYEMDYDGNVKPGSGYNLILNVAAANNDWGYIITSMSGKPIH